MANKKQGKSADESSQDIIDRVSKAVSTAISEANVDISNMNQDAEARAPRKPGKWVSREGAAADGWT